MSTYPSPDDDYPALFRQNVLRSVQAVLTRAEQEATPTVSAPVRTRLLAVLDYAFAVPESWPGLCALLRLFTPKFNLAGYWMQWLPYLEQGIAASEAHADRKTVAALCCDLGLLYQRLGKLDQAQPHLERAVTIARAEEDQPLLALALQQWAEVERLRRRYAECNALLAEARALFAPDALEQAYGLFIAGKTAFDQYDYTTAADVFTQAMQLWQTAGNQGRAALCTQNLGRIAYTQGDYRAAIALYEQAMELLLIAGDFSNLPVVQLNLGVAYSANQQHLQALSSYREAETHFQSMNDMRYLAMVYNNVGLVYTALHEWHEAEVNLQHSIHLYQQLNNDKAWISAKGNLGIAYLEQTRYREAIHIFQEALTELQATTHDPEYDRLWQALTKYLAQAQERNQKRE